MISVILVLFLESSFLSSVFGPIGRKKPEQSLGLTESFLRGNKQSSSFVSLVLGLFGWKKCDYKLALVKSFWRNNWLCHKDSFSFSSLGDFLYKLDYFPGYVKSFWHIFTCANLNLSKGVQYAGSLVPSKSFFMSSFSFWSTLLCFI